MPELAFTNDMALILGLIALAVLLFVTEWVRADVIGLLMMVAVPLLGLLPPAQALAGLGSNAVISIGAVMVVGAGLDKTGLISRSVAPVIKMAGRRPNRLIVLLSALVAALSSFVQNIGAAALVLPAVQRISRDEGIPISRLLMPIGFAAIMGGTITLVGSSPLILLNDLIDPFDLKHFNLFSVTPIGVALAATGIGYFVLFGRWVLPGREAEDGHVGCLEYSEPGRHYELVVPEDLPQPLTAHIMRSDYQARLVGLAKAHGGGKFLAPDERSELHPGDTVAVVAKDALLYRLARDYGLGIKPELEVFAEDLSPDNWGLVEAVVGPRSELVSKTLGQVHFRSKYQLNTLAIYRGKEVFISDLDEVKLKIGDALLLEGPWERFRVLGEQRRWLIFCSKVKEEPVPPIKAFWAGLWFAVGLTLVLGFKLQLSVGLLTGALGMVLTKVLTIDEAYRSVDWRTIFLLAGLMPLGLAAMETGTAAYLAQRAMSLLTGVPNLVVLLALGALATLFTLVVSNVGAVILLVPVAVSLAEQTGIDPRLAALTVALATSNSFILPTHQVNALFMGAGRYHTRDFVKAGSIMSALFLAVLLLMLYLVYGVS